MKTGNNNYEKSKNPINTSNTKILINKENTKARDASRKSNSIMRNKNIINNTPINIKFKTNVGNPVSSSVIQSQHNTNNITNIPLSINNLNKPASVNISNGDEKYTNINIIVNNNYIKAVNDTHTKSSFRNELIKIDNRLDNPNADKNEKKNKSFHIQAKNIIQNRIGKIDTKIVSPDKKESKDIKLNSKSLYGGFNNLNNLKGIQVSILKNNLNSHRNNANCLLKNLKSCFANSHSNSNTNSTANSNRKFTNKIVQSKVNSSRPSREASSHNLQTSSNIKQNNMSLNMNIIKNIKDSKNNSYVDTTTQFMPIKIEEIHLTKNPLVSQAFMHNSYSELARKLKQQKPNTVRTSIQTSSNNPNQIYFSSVLNKQRNRSNDDGNLTAYKVKSFEDHKKLDSSNFSELEVSNSGNMKSSRLEDIFNLEKTLSRNLQDNKLFNNNKSFDNSLGSQTKIREGFILSRTSLDDKLTDRKEKDSSMMYFKPRPGHILKNFEGPEELHYMYVNLNQRQKLFVHNLENLDQLEIIEDNLEF